MLHFHAPCASCHSLHVTVANIYRAEMSKKIWICCWICFQIRTMLPRACYEQKQTGYTVQSLSLRKWLIHTTTATRNDFAQLQTRGIMSKRKLLFCYIEEHACAHCASRDIKDAHGWIIKRKKEKAERSTKRNNKHQHQHQPPPLTTPKLQERFSKNRCHHCHFASDVCSKMTLN